MHQFNLIFLHFTDLIRQIGYWPWCFIYHILNIQYLYIVQWNTLLPHPVLCLAVKISNIQNTIYTTQENVHDGEMCAKNEEDNIKYNLKYSFFVNITIKLHCFLLSLTFSQSQKATIFIGREKLRLVLYWFMPTCLQSQRVNAQQPSSWPWLDAGVGLLYIVML